MTLEMDPPRVPRKIQRKTAPSARMTELLVAAKREGTGDFDMAWEAAWNRMVNEKAFPHATDERRNWKVALRGAKPEFRRCWYGLPSNFSNHSLMLLAAVVREVPVADDGVVIATTLG